MGCDIHLHFEQKNEQGTWTKIDIPKNLMPDNRNYCLFAFLADVRNSGDFEPQFPERHIPDDSSISYGDFLDKRGADHEFTHAYLDEILNAPWKENNLEDCYFYIFCMYVLPRLSSTYFFIPKQEQKNIRVVMGFDN